MFLVSNTLAVAIGLQGTTNTNIILNEDRVNFFLYYPRVTGSTESLIYNPNTNYTDTVLFRVPEFCSSPEILKSWTKHDWFLL